ncbi:hypothetical protein KOW79_015979 [Hemibagrus wyckioides]|uniref:Uncharacterized protein n=1 Tax=Hemibagrus wyckioides TaxID=337641 RepID=A0A9D3NB65_9TELE|nr:hypothetical protein KOW79_015979 [Hemibagrus wyckioides]
MHSAELSDRSHINTEPFYERTVTSVRPEQRAYSPVRNPSINRNASASINADVQADCQAQVHRYQPHLREIH